MIAAPLKVWKMALIATIVVISVLSHFAKDFGNYVFEKQIDQSFNYRAPTKGKRGIIIGASLIRQGLSDPEIIEKLMFERFGIISSWVKITRGGARLEDFIQSDHFQGRVLSYKPDYFVFQETLFSFKKTNPKNENHIRTHLKLRTLFRKLMESDQVIPKIMLNDNDYSEILIDTTELDLHIENILRRRVWDPGESSVLTEFLEGLKSAGTDIVILNVPYPDKLEAKVDSLRGYESYRTFWKWSVSRFDVQFWDIERSFSFSHFYDQSHMNAKGEKIFTDWFVDKMGTYIELDTE